MRAAGIRMMVAVLLALVALPLMLIAAALVSFNTPPGHWVLEWGTERLSHGMVRLEGLGGRFPDRLRLRRLRLEDARGAWLSADDLALDWSPLQLLSGRAHVERLTAAQVEILRRPQYPQRQRPHRTRNAGFSLPFEVQLDQLAVPQVKLAAEFAGSATAVRLQGEGRFRSLEQASLRLHAGRLDRAPAVYELALESDAQRIQGRLDLQENADGPLSHLIRLPGLGALSVQLQLLGPPDALITQLAARVGPLVARVNGTLDLPAAQATLNIDMESPAMSPAPWLSWRQISLHALSRGALIAPTTSAQLQLSGLTVSALRIDSARATLHGEGGRALALDGVVEGLRLPAPLDTMFASAPIQLQGRAQMVSANGTQFDLSLTHPLVRAQAHYELAWPGTHMGATTTAAAGSQGTAERRNGGTLTASIPELAPWARLAHLDLSGKGELQASVTVQNQSTRLTLVSTLEPRGGDARLVGLLGARAQVAAAASFRAGEMQLEHAQLTSPYLAASLRGLQRDHRLDYSWQFTLSRLARLASGSDGQVSAQGRIEGTMPRLSVSAQASGALTRSGKHATLQATFNAQGLPQRPAGRLAVTGTLEGAPLAIEASLQTDAANIATLALQRLAWKSLDVSGALRVQNDWLAPEGDLSLRLANLQDLSTLAGQSITGDAEARVVFERSGRQSRAHLTMSARELAFGTTQLRTLQLQGDIVQPLRRPQLALQLSSAALVHGTPAQLSAQISGPADALELRATATTQPPTAEMLASGAQSLAGSALSLQAVWHQSQRLLQVNELLAQYRQQSARLQSPARISFRQGISVQRLQLQMPPALLQLQGRITPTLDLRASVRNFNPAAFGVVLPLVQAQGHTDIDLELHGDLARPSGRLMLSAGGLGAATGAARGLPPAALRVAAQLADGSAHVEATLSAGERMRLRAVGNVPLRRTDSMAVRLQGNMDLAVANPLLEGSGQRLLGQLAVEAQLSGTLSAPQARGSLSIRHGDLQDYPRGLHISDLDVVLDAQGSQLLLKQFTGHAGPGVLVASGSLNLGEAGLPMELKLVARNAEPLKSDLLTANLNADLRVAGALSRRELTASGELRVNTATINIPNALPPDVQTLEVVRSNQAPAPPPPKPLFGQLELTVNAPRGIYVRGRGLNVEVGGTVHIAGKSSAPVITGGFDLINGLMDLAGSTLTFSNGRVSFNGSGLRHKIDPTLDFVAISALGGTTATLHVTGYADAPVITLTSTPPAPPDQILAQLLFGENTSQLSALQVAGIASALVTLTGAGGGGGLNPLNSVQRALGLNRLVISSGSPSAATPTGQTNTGVTIQAGRYVSSRIYVGAKQSTNGLTQAQVQVDLTRQLKIQTTLSTGGGTVQGATPENDPGSSVGISYQFQY